MREISLHILDIAKNSVTAGAKHIDILLTADDADDLLTLIITDDGKGMSPAFLARVTDPFCTTRTTRKVGMGLPLLRTHAELAGGSLAITSEEGVGTVVKATFGISSIDRMPLGDLAETVMTLVSGSPQSAFTLTVRRGNAEFVFDTEHVKGEIGAEGLDDPPIMSYLTDYIRENLTELVKGI